MILNSEDISMVNQPRLGDTIIIRRHEYTVCCTPLGYSLVKDGRRHSAVGIHESIRSLVAAIREQNSFNTPLSRKRTEDLKNERSSL
jgi:hypothetical protein